VPGAWSKLNGRERPRRLNVAAAINGTSDEEKANAMFGTAPCKRVANASDAATPAKIPTAAATSDVGTLIRVASKRLRALRLVARISTDQQTAKTLLISAVLLARCRRGRWRVDEQFDYQGCRDEDPSCCDCRRASTRWAPAT